MRNRFKRLGIINNFKSTQKPYHSILREKNIEEYNKNPNLCEECGVQIHYNKLKDKSRFCNHSCAGKYNNRVKPHKWSDADKQRLREQSKKNPYFNGIITSHKRKRKKQPNYKICPNCETQFENNNKYCCSMKCCKEYGIVGGLREKSGIGKQGWYKNYFCNSSWELAWVIYNLDYGIKFIRNKEGFPYIFNDRQYKFYPDFLLTDTNTYVEIKGYKNEKTNAKFECFNQPFYILDKNSIKPYLNYVIEKYGKDFTRLYES